MSSRALQRSGVCVKMVTGDSEETACSIAARLNIFRVGHSTMSGEAVDGMSVEELQKNISHVSVFYRTSPRHKTKIVKALQVCVCFSYL